MATQSSTDWGLWLNINFFVIMCIRWIWFTGAWPSNCSPFWGSDTHGRVEYYCSVCLDAVNNYAWLLCISMQWNIPRGTNAPVRRISCMHLITYIIVTTCLLLLLIMLLLFLFYLFSCSLYSYFCTFSMSSCDLILILFFLLLLLLLFFLLLLFSFSLTLQISPRVTSTQCGGV